MNGDTNGANDLYAATAPLTAPGEIHFATWQVNANEADGQAVINVVRNAPYATPATVDYSVQNGSASVGNDYQATSGTLSFAAGQSTASFTVPLNGADAFAGTRSATLTLANPSGASLGFSTASLNLTGVLPTVPVSVTSPTPRHPRPRRTNPGTGTTPTTSSGGGAGSSIITVYTAGSTSTTTPTDSSTTGTTTGSTSVSTTSTPASGTVASASTGTSTTAGGTTSSSSTSGASGTTTTTTTTSNSTSTSTTPTVTATGTTTTSMNASAGPVVSSLSVQTARRRITKVIITFNGPMDASSVTSAGNYGIRLLTLGRRPRGGGARPIVAGRVIGIGGTSYDPTTHQAFLTLRSSIPTRMQFQLVASGGLIDQNGNTLNSPAKGIPGTDFVYNVNANV